MTNHEDPDRRFPARNQYLCADQGVLHELRPGRRFPADGTRRRCAELRDVNVPIGGFIKAAEAERARTDARDLGGRERIGARHEGCVRTHRRRDHRCGAAGRIRRDHLDLHGAMVTEHLDDGEGELLERVRRIVGDRMPVVVSLDLHANVTARMFKHGQRARGIPDLSSRRHGGDRRARCADSRTPGV